VKRQPIRRMFPIERMADQGTAMLMQPGTVLYSMGPCTIIVSPPFEEHGWHMSISCERRYPDWDEVAHARYKLLPASMTFAMMLPPPDEYVNLHQTCFHLHEIRPGEIRA